MPKPYQSEAVLQLRELETEINHLATRLEQEHQARVRLETDLAEATDASANFGRRLLAVSYRLETLRDMLNDGDPAWREFLDRLIDTMLLNNPDNGDQDETNVHLVLCPAGDNG